MYIYIYIVKKFCCYFIPFDCSKKHAWKSIFSLLLYTVISKFLSINIKSRNIYQKLIYTNNQHPIIIIIWNGRIFRNNDSNIGIWEHFTYSILPYKKYHISRLNIIALITFVSDKIKFQLLVNSVTFFIRFIQGNNSPIYFKSPYFKLIEDNISIA